MEALKAILVDDEPLALRRLDNMLKKFEGIKVAAAYVSATQALQQIGIQKPDAVFLDISMPGLTGLEMAARIREVTPHTIIVFITAYDSHAVEAFELSALDYLLKPISLARLGKTVQRLIQSRELMARVNTDPSPLEELTLYCLGTMRIQIPGQPPEPLKWRTTKAKDVFTYLFHHRGQLVNRDVLLDLFWPELEEQNAITNLQTTIYRIRSLWKAISASLPNQEEILTINYLSRGYCLELKRIRIDAEEWERQLSEVKPVSTDNVEEHRKLVEEYYGNYLGDDGYTWAEMERQRLKALWLRQVKQLGQFYEERGMMMDCLSIYHKVLRLDPLLEESYLLLMKTYARLKDASSVHNHFDHLKKMLWKEMGTTPGREVLNWFKEWTNRERIASGRSSC